MPSFANALRSGRVLLMDGPMYTELRRAGLGDGECAELWNLALPHKVQAVHQSYLDAGAEILLTNTFQANSAALRKAGLEDRLKEICAAGERIARQAAGPDRFVLASIGPMENPDTGVARALTEAFHEVDGLILETQSDVRLLELVLEQRKVIPGLDPVPIVFSFTFLRNPRGEIVTWTGLSPEEAALLMSRYPVAALGVNCGRDIDMEDIIEIVSRYRQVTGLPVLARPNAGAPNVKDSQWLYPRSEAEMVMRFPDLVKAGASMVGGCCGTTPDLIRGFRRLS